MSAKYKQLYRSRDERMVAGICGGLGEYLDIDPTVIRLIFVFGTILTGSGLFWAYLVMMLVVPEEPVASEAVVEAPVVDYPAEES
jgi:phage shock protein C